MFSKISVFDFSLSTAFRTFLFLGVALTSLFMGGAEAEAGTTPTIENGGLWYYRQVIGTDYSSCQTPMVSSNQTCIVTGSTDNGDTYSCTPKTPDSGYVWVDRSYNDGGSEGGNMISQWQQCLSSTAYTVYSSPVATFAASTDKDTYAPGGTVTVSVAAASGDQSSTMGGFFSGGIINSINNSFLNPFCVLFCTSTPAVGVTATYGGFEAHCEETGACDNSNSPGKTFTAPSYPGTYTINLSGWWYVSDQNIGTSSMTFTVAATATDGVCSSPATHYTCSSSTASTNNDGTTDPTKWTWKCPGTGAGATVSCSETKPVGVCDNTGGFACTSGNSVGKVGALDGTDGGWSWYCEAIIDDTATRSSQCHYCITGLGYSWDASSSSCVKAPTYILSVFKSPGVGGTVTSADGGINCGTGTGCTKDYADGTSVTLSATAASGYSFAGWSGDCTGSTCIVSMIQARAVTATFTADAPTGWITINSMGPTQANGTCTANVSWGSTDAPLAGFGPDPGVWRGETSGDKQDTPSTWGGPTTTSGMKFNLYLDYSKQIATANSAILASKTSSVCDPLPIYHTLSVLKSGTGSGTVTSGDSPQSINCGSGAGCSSSYISGTSVTLTASATSGTFTGWSGDCSGTDPCTVKMDAAKAVTATFTATAVGAGGCGTAATNYASSAKAYSGTYCSTSYGNSSIPTFPAAGSSSSWTCNNEDGTTGPTCTATRAVAVVSYTLSVFKSGSGTVNSTSPDTTSINCGTGAGCTSNYTSGTSVTLSATAATASGYSFAGWSGDCSGTDNCVVSMTQARSVTATFTTSALTATISATSPILYNTASTLTITSSNATSCTLGHWDAGTWYSSLTPINSSPSTGALTANRTYYLRCNNSVASVPNDSSSWLSTDIVVCASGQTIGSDGVCTNVTPVTGVCGTVNGTTVSSLASNSANLCSPTTPTLTSGSFSGTGPWSWKCDGVNSGSKSPLCTAIKGCPTDCSATKASTICLGQSFGNGCGVNCLNKGTRVCGSSWKEVVP